MSHPLVSISGIPGSGKSLLLSGLQKTLRWQVLRYDDFEGMTAQPPDVVRAWVGAGMPVEQAFIPAFSKSVLDMLTEGHVLMETPFGPLHLREGLPITRSIWLDCPPDLALSRAFLKEISGDGWQSVRDMQGWAAAYLTAYPDFVKAAIDHQIRTVSPLCDVVLDARQSPSEILDRALAAISDMIQ
jgi:uridine kinase